MSAPPRDDETDVADRLHAFMFWLFVAGIVGSLWFYAEARSVVARTPRVLPPPAFPTTQPARHFPWHADLAADEEGLSASDLGDVDAD